MNNNEEQTFGFYAVPCNRPFVLKIENKEEFEKKSEEQLKEFQEKMKRLEEAKLNLRKEEPLTLTKKLNK